MISSALRLEITVVIDYGRYELKGPMDVTIEDFWRMIEQENVGYIIMLCDLMELGKKKCEKYIPENVDEEKTYGGTVIKEYCRNATVIDYRD